MKISIVISLFVLSLNLIADDFIKEIADITLKASNVVELNGGSLFEHYSQLAPKCDNGQAREVLYYSLGSDTKDFDLSGKEVSRILDPTNLENKTISDFELGLSFFDDLMLVAENSDGSRTIVIGLCDFGVFDFSEMNISELYIGKNLIETRMEEFGSDKYASNGLYINVEDTKSNRSMWFGPNKFYSDLQERENGEIYINQDHRVRSKNIDQDASDQLIVNKSSVIQN